MTQPTDPSESTTEVRYLVIGAGPGGLQMAYFLGRAGRDYLVLERADHPGAFFTTFPRHRQLISINKKHNYFDEDEFNSRHDWNSLLSDDPELRFTEYSDELFPSADDMTRYLADFAEQTEARIRYGAEVVEIDREPDGRFLVRTADGGLIRAQVVLLGTGASVERRPDIEGIELTTPYGTHDTDLERYRIKRVGILGQGNSAFETADHLSGSAAYVHILGHRPVTMAWNSHFPGDVRAVNNDIFDMFQLKSMHAVLAPRVVRIDRVGDCLQTTHEYDYPNASTPGTLRLTREYDEIICCTGFGWMPSHLFSPRVQPDTWKGGKFPSLTPLWESTNVADLYVIGGAMQGNDRKSASGFIHGFRYNVRTLAKVLEERYEDTPYPATVTEPFDWPSFEEHLYRRLSTTAALFQLYGTLADEVVVAADGSRCTIREELPLDHLDQLDHGDDHVFTVTLEFGFHHYDEPAITFLGPSDPTDTRAAAFLHPVIRHRHGDQRDEFHFGDSLLGRWDLPPASGGAVMPYHHAFRRWFHGRLGWELPGEAVELGGDYRPWTDAEREAWEADHPERPSDATYRNPLSTAQGAPGPRP